MPFPSSPSFVRSTVTIDASKTLAVMPANWLGMNTTAPNLYSLDAAVPGGQPSTTSLLAAINSTVCAFPGGPLGQRYIWDGSNAANNASHPYLTASYTDFLDTDPVGLSGHGAAGLSADTLVTQARAAGNICMMTVNYGTNKTNTAGGDPALAATWVTHHNTNGTISSVPYWCIGAETYWNVRTGGSDLTGVTPNKWADVSAGYQSATNYGTNAAAFWTAMKAADTSGTIKCGLVAWTDGGSRAGPAPTAQSGWTYAMLQAFKTATSGAKPDFLIVHDYAVMPGFENDTTMLLRDGAIETIMGALNGIATALYGSTIPVIVGECNISDTPPLSRQTANMVGALYASHIPLLWIERGAQMVVWWSDHCSTVYTTGATTSFPSGAPLYGSGQYGTFGLLSSARSGTLPGGGTVTEPAVNTPYPAYYAFRCIAYAATSGDTLIRVKRSDPLATQVHAWHRADGKLSFKVENRDSGLTQRVQVVLSNFTLGASGGTAGTATDYTYDPTQSGITTTPRTGLTGTDVVTLPPYGMLTRVYS